MFARLTSAASAVMILAFAAPGFAQALTPPPLEAFRRHPSMSDVVISKDGGTIAYLVNNEGRRRLVVQTLSGKPLQILNLNDAKVRGLQFAGPKHLLIHTSITGLIPGLVSFQERDEHFQAQSLNLETGKVVYLMDSTKGGTTNIVLGAVDVRSIGGSWKALAPSWSMENGRVNLYRIDLDTGRGEVHEEGTPGAYSWRVDESGRAYGRIEYSSTTRHWRLLARPRTSNTWREIVNVRAPIDRPSAYRLGRDGESIVVLMQRGDSPSNLYEVSMSDGSVSEPLLKNVTFFSHPISSPLSGRLAGLVSVEHEAEYEWFDSEMRRVWESVKSPFRNDRVSIQSYTPDLSKVIARVEGKANAGSYYLIDLPGRRADLIGEERPNLPKEFVAETRVLTYKATDGLEIPAYLTLPPGREVKNLPLIVMPHGGPASRDFPGFDDWTQAIASRGYAVLRPQFRGSEGFGDAHLEAGFGQWGRKMQTDLSDGVRHLAVAGLVDPERVCIFGWSYGGYAAMAGPTLDPGVYRCAAAGAGVSDLGRMVDWVSDGGGDRRSTSASRYWNRFMGPRDKWDEVSPAKHADKVTVPVLLIHGRDDTIVPFEQSMIFASAMKRAGKPYELVELKSEDHWLSKDATSTEMLKSLITFLEKHNPPN